MGRLAGGLWRRFDFIRFAAASGFAFGLDFTLYYLLTWVVIPEAANVASSLTAMIFNFVMHRRVVFKNGRRSMGWSFVLSVSLSLVGMGISTATITLVRLGLPGHVVVPKLLGTGLAFIWNYLTKKHIAFRAVTLTG